MRERCEVARSAQRSLFGHDREQVALEHLDKPQHNFAPDARNGRAQGRAPAAPAWRGLPPASELVADRHRVRAEKPVLESRRVLGREPYVGQASETGRDPVHDRPGLEGIHDDLPGGVDSAEDLFAQHGASARRDRNHILYSERAA